MLIKAYESGDSENLPLAPLISEAANAQAEEERVRRFMEIKAQSIAFKRSVARELDKAGIAYRQDVTENLVVTDFLVEVGDRRIALECKFNLHRDFEKTIFSSRLIHTQFGCCSVFVIVPFHDESLAQKLSAESEVQILALQDLAEQITLYNKPMM